MVRRGGGGWGEPSAERRLLTFMNAHYLRGRRRKLSANLLAQDDGGRYLVDEAHISEMHRLMADAADAEFYLSLTETLTQHVHFFADIDFHIQAHTPARARGAVNLGVLLRLLQSSVRHVVSGLTASLIPVADRTSSATFATSCATSDCRLLALTVDVPAPKAHGFKVGVHVHGPRLVLRPTDLVAIRNHAITQDWTGVVDESCLLLNGVETVYDAAPYRPSGEKGALRLAFCKKTSPPRGGGGSVYRPRILLTDAADIVDKSELLPKEVLTMTRIQVAGAALLEKAGASVVALDSTSGDELGAALKKIYAPLATAQLGTPKVVDLGQVPFSDPCVQIPLKTPHCGILGGAHSTSGSGYLSIRGGYVTQRCSKEGCQEGRSSGCFLGFDAQRRFRQIDADGFPLRIYRRASARDRVLSGGGASAASATPVADGGVAEGGVAADDEGGVAEGGGGADGGGGAADGAGVASVP